MERKLLLFYIFFTHCLFVSLLCFLCPLPRQRCRWIGAVSVRDLCVISWNAHPSEHRKLNFKLFELYFFSAVFHWHSASLPRSKPCCVVEIYFIWVFGVCGQQNSAANLQVLLTSCAKLKLCKKVVPVRKRDYSDEWLNPLTAVFKGLIPKSCAFKAVLILPNELHSCLNCLIVSLGCQKFIFLNKPGSDCDAEVKDTRSGLNTTPLHPQPIHSFLDHRIVTLCDLIRCGFDIVERGDILAQIKG